MSAGAWRRGTRTRSRGGVSGESSDLSLSLEAVTAEHLRKVLAMAGGSVYCAGAGLGGNVITEDDRYLFVVQRMFDQKVFQHLALAAGEAFCLFKSVTRKRTLRQ